jgi:hypothetical protein
MFFIKSLIIFSLLLFQSAFGESNIGSCIRDPNAKHLQEEWLHYHELQKKKAKINIKVMTSKILMSKETLNLVKAISDVEGLMVVLDELENKYLKKAFVDKRFNDTISSPDFVAKLARNEVADEIKKSELKFKDDPAFYDVLDRIRLEVIKPEVKAALDLFRELDLGVLEAPYRKSAKQALRLIRSKGGTKEVLASWEKDPPFLKNVPMPAEKLGPFAIKYRSLLMKSIVDFVVDRNVTLDEARLLFPKMKQADVDLLNTMNPPNENNSFDDYIFPINSPEIAAIDGVTRTLWGEATSCQMQGLAQFEAIGRIIADRSIAVCKAIVEQQQLSKKNEEVREKNWTTFLSNWAGIKRPAPGMQNKATLRLKGLSDFGRKERLGIPCAAQVVSKKNQFSVWNSYSIKKFQTGQFHPNIPNATYELKGPQAENDDKALMRILCPEFQNEEQKKLWEHAREIAELIVKKPEHLVQKYAWPLKGEILFYTHEAKLPFAKEIKVDHLLVDQKKLMIKGKSKRVCDKFRLFVPKVNNQYY